MADFVARQPGREESENSWTIDAKTIDAGNCDLSVRNPNRAEEAAIRSPQDILDEMTALDEESAKILAGLRVLV